MNRLLLSYDSPFSRREFLAVGIGALVLASVPLAARRCGRLVRRTVPLMGTIAEIVVLHDDEYLAQEAIDAAFTELRRVEALMTRFSATSDIGRVNLARVGAATVVSAETQRVVEEALRWADARGGAYDPAIGGAVALWDVINRHEPPPDDRVREYAGRKFYRAIESGRRSGGAVVIRHEALGALDLGSIAKGYGVDRAIAVLRGRGFTQAVVAAGGDLHVIGDGPDHGGWQIGIQSPFDSHELLGRFALTDAAVATSGTYLRYFQYRGRRYHHLLDPETGAPRETLVKSFTVRADSCMHADVASTACYGMLTNDAALLLQRRVPRAQVLSVI